MRTFALAAIAGSVLLIPGGADAQVKSFDLTLAGVVHAGSGVGGPSLRDYRTGFGARLSYGIGRLWAVALATRAYVIETPIHADVLFPPLPDGTYIQVDRAALYSAPFVTTDLRLRANFDPSGSSAGVEVGFGNAWRSGYDFPYGLFGVSVPIRTGHKVRLLLEGEYLILRATTNRYQRTWQNSLLVSTQYLGQIHEWGDALAVGIGVHVAF